MIARLSASLKRAFTPRERGWIRWGATGCFDTGFFVVLFLYFYPPAVFWSFVAGWVLVQAALIKKPYIAPFICIAAFGAFEGYCSRVMEFALLPVMLSLAAGAIAVIVLIAVYFWIQLD